MSKRRPRISGKALIRKLQQHGFEISRSRGSHFFLKHSDGRATVVPVHKGETIGPGLLARILHDAELNTKDIK